MVTQEEREKFAKILWDKVKELQIERAEVFRKHEEYLKKHPPKFDNERGSFEGYVLATKIKSMIEAGKLLGLIDEDVDPGDHFVLKE